MTDTTGTITYPPLERYEFTFIVPSDPRDARIAELEAALRDIKFSCELVELYAAGKLAGAIGIANAVLMPSPEGDMQITQEEMGA